MIEMSSWKRIAKNAKDIEWIASAVQVQLIGARRPK